jgi:hypothetical protein
MAGNDQIQRIAKQGQKLEIGSTERPIGKNSNADDGKGKISEGW